MRITVVGCSGSHPGPDAACSSYLVEHDGFRLLIDLGNGALGPLQRYVDPRDLDAVFVSHLHADHWLDLVPYAHVRRHHPDGRVPSPVRLVAPVADRKRIAGAFGRPVEALADVFKFEEPHDTTIGPFDVKVTRTRHPVETYAARVSASAKTLVYTADTGPFDGLATFARGADVLLAEAGFVDGDDNPPDTHLTASDAGRVASAAGVGTLVVTHVAPWHDAGRQLERARTAFGGRAQLAVPGAMFDI